MGLTAGRTPSEYNEPSERSSGNLTVHVMCFTLNTKPVFDLSLRGVPRLPSFAFRPSLFRFVSPLFSHLSSPVFLKLEPCSTTEGRILNRHVRYTVSLLPYFAVEPCFTIICRILNRYVRYTAPFALSTTAFCHTIIRPFGQWQISFADCLTTLLTTSLVGSTFL